MSSVDERIVKMVFDNADFATKVASTIKSINQLNQATDQVANSSGGGLSAMSKAFEQAEIMSTRAGFHIQDVWLKVASILENQVAGKIVKIGKDIANAMTFEGIADGFDEYQLKMGSVQTIMAGTGESLQTVNKYLNELNTYSDKTIYSFADMTNNIGKFTNAGVGLEDAVLAIKGIANEAAISGANANEASRAMYNFSQALSAGYVKLIDWKSIENANMATKGFKDTLLEVASAVGTVEKQGDGMYKVLTKNAQGKSMEDLVSGTKNFNDSLQQQWMTTEVLTKALKIYATDIRDLSKEEKAAYESELRAMGLSDEQIKKFEQLGSKATDAASEIKTFSMLIDTLKEAIGSGWAQTWEFIIGDFEEAKALWTSVGKVLGGIIDKSSETRNKILEGWNALGGRQWVIDGLTNAFNFLQKAIQPIKTALREVFPPKTTKDLLRLSASFRKLTETLSFGREEWNKVHSIAKGFFSVFDIGIKFVKAFLNAILPVGKGLSSLGGSLLDAAANLGDFISNLDKTITEGKVFEKFFDNVGKVVKPVFDFILSGAKGALGILSKFFGSFTSNTGKMSSAGEVLQNVFDNISKGIENIKKKFEALKPLFEGLKSLFKGIGSILGSAFKQMGDSLTGFASNDGGNLGIINVINSLLTGGILYKLFSGVKSFSQLGDSLTGVLDSISDTLSSFQKKIEADNLLNIAKAIAILAGSLVVVAMVDSNKLLGATSAITALMFGLSGAMAVLMKAVNSFSTTQVESTFSMFGKKIFGIDAGKMIQMSVTLGAVSKALISMGAAVLMMAVGLKVVSSAAEGGHLWDSFAVISLILAELTGVAIVLGKWGGDTKEATKGLISMSASLIIMAKALEMISEVVSTGNAWESLGILGLMVAGLTGVMIALDKLTEKKAISMLPLISMAISINLLVFALKQVSDALGTEGQHIWQALGVIGLMVAGLAGVCVVLSKFAGFSAAGGFGAILAATSLLILVQALKQISDALGQTDQHIWQALGVIAASLLVLAVGLTAMSATIPGAAGLLIASAALVVLGAALKIIGSMSLAEIGKGLLAMAGSLIILAAGLTAMLLALPGAVALTVAAFGLTVLAGALKLFSSMSLGEIGKSLLTLVAALVGIAAISTALSVLSPFILAFSAALVVFGVALMATGTGMTMFAAGLTALLPLLPILGTAITVLANALLSLLPIIVEKLCDALAVLASKIVEYAPTFGAACLAIIDLILDVLAGSALKFGETVLALILGILQVLTENIPLIAQAGTDLMIAYMEAIATEIPRVVDSAYQCAIALINGLADAIESNNSELIAAVDHLMEAVIQAITQWLVEFTPLGLLIPENMKEGIMSGEISVKDAIGNVIRNAVEAIKGFFADFKQAAEYLIGGFIEGLKGTAVGQAVSAAAELGSKVIGGLNSKKGIDSHSPSIKAILSGMMVALGLKKGIDDNADKAVESSAKMGGDVTEALVDPLKEGVGEAKEVLGEYSDVIDTEAVESLTNLTDASILNTEATKENIKAQEESTEATKETNQALNDLTTDEERHLEIQKKNTEARNKAIDAHKEEMKVLAQSMKNTRDRNMTLKETQHHMENLKYATDEHTESVEKNTEAQENNTEATGKAGKAAKAQADVMEYASGVVEAFTAQYGHLYTNLGDDSKIKVAQFAIRNLAEETYKASLKAKDAADQNEKTKASLEEMIKSFTELKTKIYDSVKSMFEGDSFFQKFEMKTEKTMADMLEGMRSNVNAVASWTAKLSDLGNRGLEQGLLKQLAELGPKGFEYVNAFSMATEEQIQEANALFAQASVLPESASNSVVASYAKAGLNAVQGFTNAITEEELNLYATGEQAGTTLLSGLENRLEIESPSKATYRDGEYLVQGLNNGIQNNVDFVYNTITIMCERIISTMETLLAKDRFYTMGVNIAMGLAEGMASAEALAAVESAATALSEAAAHTTVGFNEIGSPSKLYKRYGDYIAEGLAMGMVGGTSYVEHGARMLSESIKNSLAVVESIAENDMEIHPVITPVLDLTGVRQKANAISGLFPVRSIGLASSIGVGTYYGGDGAEISTENGGGYATQINYTQNNYSPKALSRVEIYRDTKNQLSMLKSKGVVMANG